MATHGRLDKFDPEKDDWTIYIATSYFLANEVPTKGSTKFIAEL